MTISTGDALLERSAQLEALAERLRAVSHEGRGRLVLVAGEAGIGKTSLVRAFCESRPSLTVLSGACDALHTPRPLGPLLDIAEEVGGELAAAVREGVSPGVLVSALVHELRGGPPVVVVLEDVHWADEATLDVVRLLERRIETLPVLLLATYRDDELEDPLRIVLGELTSRTADRIRLAPLSPEAVAVLAGPAVADADELHRRTAGNPFYVTEVVAAGGEIPDTVRDAVLARAARLDPGARALLDIVAIIPSRAELWLLEALTDGDLNDLDQCLALGVLRAQRDAVGFRHEIARVAVEEALPPHRSAPLHRRVLRALGDADPARLAHHAEAAGDSAAVLAHAPVAGERAAEVGSHREAAAQFARALRHAADVEPARRAALLERRSYECYLTDRIADAIEARQAALEEHRASGNRLGEGDAHRWLSRLSWFKGDNATAEREARLAVELLEPLAPGRELAAAYSNMAQLRMLASDRAAAQEWGARAIELAERLGETEILVHALNNVGSAELQEGIEDGRAALERSLALAIERGPRGARGAGVHEPGRDGGRRARLRGGRSRAARGDLLLHRARPRFLAALHDRAPGPLGPRSGALGRCGRTRDVRARASGRRDAEPHHAAHRGRPPPRSARRPRSVRAARRGAEARAPHGRRTARRGRRDGPCRGTLARRTVR